MRFAIVGAGAIGGYLGARLAAAGNPVTFIARGANLSTIQARGIELIEEDGTRLHATDVKAAASCAQAGVHDAVLLGLKAHQVAAIAPELSALCKADTSIVTLQNGIPWWYFYKHGGEYEGTPIAAADPGGVIARSIDVSRVIGCIVYPAATLAAPGVVQVVEGNRFSLGELDGTTTERLQALSACLTAARFKAPVTDDIRGELWLKLWGNLSFNPISALTHATLEGICKFPSTRQLAAAMMAEAQAVAAKLGVTFKVSIERRIAGAERVGAHKTSMLQDVEQGRAMELEALVGAVIELGKLTGVPTPHISSVYACASLLSETLSSNQAKLSLEPAAR